MSKKKIAIVGAGFAGLAAYTKLKKYSKYIDIQLFDERKSFEYTPALHAVVVRPQSDKKISMEIKRIAGDDFIHEKVTTITDKKIVTVSNKEFDFDLAIGATGSVTNYFGNDSFKTYGMPYKSLSDVEAIRKLLPNAKVVTVIGGGYTGVEIASILATQTDKTIQLIHSRETVLDKLPSKVASIAQEYITKNGVKLILGDRAKEYTQNSIILESGTEIETDIIIQSSGIAPQLDCMTCEKPDLDENLCICEQPSVLLCGDVARTDLPPTAHNAIIEGRKAAENALVKLGIKKSSTKHTSKFNVLAVALGRTNGVIVMNQTVIPLPFFTGLFKWFIEKKTQFEFKTGLQLPM